MAEPQISRSAPEDKSQLAAAPATVLEERPEKPAPQQPVRTNSKDGLTYVFIPSATSSWACSPGDTECYDDEKPPIPKGSPRLLAGPTEVTQTAWKKLNGGVNPSHFKAISYRSNKWTGIRRALTARQLAGGFHRKGVEYAARAGTTGRVTGRWMLSPGIPEQWRDDTSRGSQAGECFRPL